MSDTAEQAILELVAARGVEKSICPTEAARRLAGDAPGDAWRKFLHPVRLAAVRLARAEKIEILRKGKPVAPDEMHGVIRLRVKL